MQVLVVDDSPLAAKILAASLTADGHQPVVAADAAQALKLMASNPIAVVISDWEMPGMSGAELCRAVRTTARGPHTYFLLLTSRDDQQSLIDACDVGADDLLLKPLDPDRLTLRMRSIERALKVAAKLPSVVIPGADLADQHSPGGHVRP